MSAVCLKRIGEMSAALSHHKSASALEQGIRDVCRSYTDKADQRFCYYIGGSDDAATSLLRTVSGALMNHLPPVKVCEKLKAADGQICAVKYEQPAKPIDWATVDLNKMRVKETEAHTVGLGRELRGMHREGRLHQTNQRNQGQTHSKQAGAMSREQKRARVGEWERGQAGSRASMTHTHPPILPHTFPFPPPSLPRSLVQCDGESVLVF